MDAELIRARIDPVPLPDGYRATVERVEHHGPFGLPMHSAWKVCIGIPCEHPILHPPQFHGACIDLHETEVERMTDVEWLAIATDLRDAATTATLTLHRVLAARWN